MKQHNSLLDRLMDTVDLVDEPLPRIPIVELSDDRRVLIENHCGVISYSQERVAVKTKSGCICVLGSGLVLTRMSKEQLRICGTIRTIELCGRK